MANQNLFCWLLFLAALTAHGAPAAETLKNSPLSLPAAEIAFGVATNLSGPTFQIGAISPVTASGGSATQSGSQQWFRLYSGGPGSVQNGAYAMAARPDGGVVVTGYSYLPGADYDFATVCYAADGQALWTNRFDGAGHGNETARLVGIATNGTVYIAGESMRYATNSTLTDVILIQYASNGVPVWTNRFSGTGTNGSYAYGLLVDQQGNAYVRYSVTSWSGYIGTPVEDVLVKFDSAGNSVWVKHYPVSAGDTGNDLHDIGPMCLDRSGNLIIAGPTGFGSMITGFSIEKLAANGTAIWTNHLAWSFVDWIYYLTTDLEGNPIATAQRWDNTNRVYLAMKFSEDGPGLWTNSLAGPSYDGVNVPQTLADNAGNVFVIGGAPAAPQPVYRMLKISANGIPLWTNPVSIFGQTNAMIGSSALDFAGNIYIAGYAAREGGADRDFVTAKYSNAGQLLWTRRFNSSPGSDNFAYNLAVDDFGSVYVSGESQSPDGTSSFATVKYSEYIFYTPPRDFIGVDTVSGNVFDSKGANVPFALDIQVEPGSFRFNPAGTFMAPSGMHLRVDGVPGTNAVVLEGSTNYVDWQTLQSAAPAGGTVQFLDTSALQNRVQYYRVRQQW